MTDYTEGPWEQEAPYGHLVIDRAGNLVADCARPEDARRIVACVNACEGISTENLEENKPIIELARAYNVSLRQRDDLLEALQVMVRDYSAAHASCGDLEMSPALFQAQRAIARATGEQP